MRTNEDKLKFIQMRAENKSYGTISKEMGLSTDTCSKWENELESQIKEHKAEQLDELYTAYYMTKEARIKQLGESLKTINTALEGRDLTEMQPEKLFDLKLKYMAELNKEFTEYKTPDQNNPFYLAL